MVTYTVPGMKTDQAQDVIGLLQDRLNSLNDLALTLKHVDDYSVGRADAIEQFHWLVRAHLERPDGSLATGNARIEQEAAERATGR